MAGPACSPSPARKVAVFDVCGTLYRSNTTFDFLDFHLPRAGFKARSLRALCRCRPVTLLGAGINRLFHQDLLRRYGVHLLKGERPGDLAGAARAFVREFLEARRVEPVFELMEGYRDRGYAIVLLSASLDFVVEAVAEAVGAEAAFGSTLGVRGGRLTGGIGRDLRFGKRQLFRSAFPAAETIAFTTDDLCDLPLVRLADECHLVSRSPAHLASWKRLAPPGAHLLELE